MSDNKKNRKTADPLKTKTGKTRLGPLNKTELEKMIESSSKKKHRAMAQRVYDRKYKHLVVAQPIVEETTVLETVEPELVNVAPEMMESTTENVEVVAEAQTAE
jgi:hypothetical protein